MRKEGVDMPKLVKISVALCLSIAILFILTNMNKEYIANSQFSLEPTEEVTKNRRILVVAPHCDDEILGPGGIIYQALQKGDQVKVVMMTNGDGFLTAADVNFPLVFSQNKRYLDLGELRQKETIAGLGVLGLAKKNILFLGYPDGGLDKLWISHWDANNPYLNPHDLFDHSPYERTYHPKTSYTGESVVRDLTEIITSYEPTDIYFPHPNDVHPDHWATNCFVKYVLIVHGLDHVTENLYLVHRGSWPMNLALGQQQELTPPEPLVNQETIWEKVPLSPEEIQQKKRAILQYHTQVKVMEPFLLAFIRSNELFGLYPNLPLPKNKTSILIADPSGDFANSLILKGADITGLWGKLTKENLELEIRTSSTPTNNINYFVHLRFLDQSGEIKRVDLSINNKNKTLLEKTSANSITEITGLETQVRDDRLLVSIPLQSLPPFQYLYLNGESKKDSVPIDKTAWKILCK